MNTKITPLLGAALVLLGTFGTTQHAAAQTGNERLAFHAPIIATTVSKRTHTTSYTTNTQILTMNVDGSDVRQLTTGTENSFFPRWRPGQTHILFHRGDTFYVMDADGAGTFPVATANGVGADWSPDGKMVCYAGRDAAGWTGLFVVSVDPTAKGKNKVGTPVMVKQGSVYGPDWSPDGTRIAYGAGGSPRVTVLDLVTGTESSLDSMHGLLPSWNSTGSQIAFVSGDNPTGDWQLFIMNADFSGVTQVTSYNNSVLWPTWSYDDTQIAFRIGTGQAGDAAIYKLTLNTGELTLLQDHADHPDWRP